MRFARFVVAASSALALLGLLVGAPACSDPTPPIAQGAWSVSLIQPDSNCMIAPHNGSVGSVSANTKEKLIVNAVDGAEIVCSVIASGNNTFSVNAKAVYNGAALYFLIDAITPAARQATPAAGRASFVTQKTVNAYQSPTDTPCNFYFIPNTPQGVAAGKIWVAFDCPKVEAEMSICGLDAGYAIFENCAQTATSGG